MEKFAESRSLCLICAVVVNLPLTWDAWGKVWWPGSAQGCVCSCTGGNLLTKGLLGAGAMPGRSLTPLWWDGKVVCAGTVECTCGGTKACLGTDPQLPLEPPI